MVMVMIMVMDMVMDIVSISILYQSMEKFSAVKTSLAPARKIVDTTQNQVMGSFRRFRICLAFDCGLVLPRYNIRVQRVGRKIITSEGLSLM